MMSTGEITKRESRFAEVMDRLKQLLAVSADKELAEALGMKGPAFANRKKLASLPFEEIDALASKCALSLDLILGHSHGAGKCGNLPHFVTRRITKSDGPSDLPATEPAPTLDIDVLAQCIGAVIDACAGRAGVSDHDRALLAAQLYQDTKLDGDRKPSAVRLAQLLKRLNR